MLQPQVDRDKLLLSACSAWQCITEQWPSFFFPPISDCVLDVKLRPMDRRDKKSVLRAPVRTTNNKGPSVWDQYDFLRYERQGALTIYFNKTNKKKLYRGLDFQSKGNTSPRTDLDIFMHLFTDPMCRERDDGQVNTIKPTAIVHCVCIRDGGKNHPGSIMKKRQ